MELSSDEIRHRRFPVRRRGYDAAAVDEFLERIAAALDSSDSDDAFETAGREIAHILRATHEEAARLRAAASAEAEAILSQAKVEAEQLHEQAGEDRAKAKELLVRSRLHVTETEAEAEERSAAIVGSAEQQAHDRVADVLRSGREQLAQLATDQQHARSRLMAAHADLQAVIHRVAEPKPLIDLTAPTTAVELDTEPAAGSPGRPAPGEGRSDPQSLPTDPLDAMVRDAVERAVAHSTRSAPAHAAGDTTDDAEQPGRPD